MAAKRIGAESVTGPNDTKVEVIFYDDGGLAVNVREAGPLAVTQAWLTGRGNDVRVRLVPAYFRRPAKK
jgi:hypothetical protein